ncbi:MAG: peptide chain release factor N(5)-glutamine methyltransferase [Chlamydiota bacterium]
MKTILDIISLSTEYLENHHVEQPRRESEQLVADVLGVKRIDLYMQFDRPLDEDELQNCREVLRRRAAREPTQYIQGSVEFYDCKIAVSTDVLIPRQETEILVDKIVKSLEGEELQDKMFWDVCCGSGCIGIAIKKRFPQLRVVLSDNSPFAVEVAQKNAKENEVDVEVLLGDLMQPFVGEKAHYLVSNPPYISEVEYEKLIPEVRKYEPREALISGSSGLEFYERFAEQLPSYLHSHAKVWFEIGAEQGDGIKKLFEREGYRQISVEKDWSDHDRFFFLEIE